MLTKQQVTIGLVATGIPSNAADVVVGKPLNTAPAQMGDLIKSDLTNANTLYMTTLSFTGGGSIDLYLPFGTTGGQTGSGDIYVNGGNEDFEGNAQSVMTNLAALRIRVQSVDGVLAIGGNSSAFPAITVSSSIDFIIRYDSTLTLAANAQDILTFSFVGTSVNVIVDYLGESL